MNNRQTKKCCSTGAAIRRSSLYARYTIITILILLLLFTTISVINAKMKMGLLPSLVLGILGKGGKRIIPLPLILPIPYKVRGRDYSFEHQKSYIHIPVHPGPEFRQPADLTIIKPGGVGDAHAYGGRYH